MKKKNISFSNILEFLRNFHQLFGFELFSEWTRHLTSAQVTSYSTFFSIKCSVKFKACNMTFIDLNVIHRYVVYIYLCMYYLPMHVWNQTYISIETSISNIFLLFLIRGTCVCQGLGGLMYHSPSYTAYKSLIYQVCIYQYIGQYHHWSFEYLHRVGTYLLVIPLPTLCMMGKIEKKTGLYLRGL